MPTLALHCDAGALACIVRHWPWEFFKEVASGGDFSISCNTEASQAAASNRSQPSSSRPRTSVPSKRSPGNTVPQEDNLSGCFQHDSLTTGLVRTWQVADVLRIHRRLLSHKNTWMHNHITRHIILRHRGIARTIHSFDLLLRIFWNKVLEKVLTDYVQLRRGTV